MEILRFNNTGYPFRNIILPNIGEVTLATTTLNSKIINEDGSYTSENARLIDEKIYYFVDDNEMLFCDKALTDIVSQIS